MFTSIWQGWIEQFQKIFAFDDVTDKSYPHF